MKKNKKFSVECFPSSTTLFVDAVVPLRVFRKAAASYYRSADEVRKKGFHDDDELFRMEFSFKSGESKYDGYFGYVVNMNDGLPFAYGEVKESPSGRSYHSLTDKATAISCGKSVEFYDNVSKNSIVVRFVAEERD